MSPNSPTNLEAYWQQVVTEFQMSKLTTSDTLRFREQELTPQNEGRSLPRIHFKEDNDDEDPDFALGKILGEGGMGRVCLAEQLPLHREVAIKMLRFNDKNFEMNVRLLQEARLTGLLEHPNIVPIHQLGKDRDGSPLLVMKRIDGVPWSDILSQKRKGSEDLPRERLTLDWHIQVLMQVCHAVEYAHSKQIVHRDLKPENVMVGEFGEVYVLDWGLAISIEEGKATHLPALGAIEGFCGTPVYMAPEMILEDDSEIDVRTDVYLMGAILHEILVGEPPHQGAHLMQIFAKIRSGKPFSYPKEISPELAAICKKAMHKEKSERYESAKAFREALQDYLTNQESHALCAEAQSLYAKLSEHLQALSPAPQTEALAQPLSYRLPADLDQEIARLYWRAHFAYTQALRIWPENQQASDGLQLLLKAMIHYRLDEGNYVAAEAMVSELQEPSEELLTRIEETKAIEHQKLEQLKELHRTGREQDTSIGAVKRQVVLTLIIIFLGFSSFGVFLLDHFGIFSSGHYIFLMNDLVFVAYIFVALFIGKEVFLKNLFNRRLVKMVVLFSALFTITRILFIWFEISVYKSMCFDMVLLFSCVATYAIFYHGKLIYVAFTFLVALVASLLWPKYQFVFLGLSHWTSAGILTFYWKVLAQEEVNAHTLTSA